MPNYSDSTYASASKIKRWLHEKRFAAAIKILNIKSNDIFLDYGCGDAHLLQLCAKIWPAQNLFGFEPAASLRDQAIKTVALLGVKLVGNLSELNLPINGQRLQFTKIACLETCEHLLGADLQTLFSNVQKLLTPNGTFVVSVPIEIGLPALFKNIFRFLKNKNHDNLTFKTLFTTTFGLNTPRNLSQQLNALNYIYSHIGFNHKLFEKTLQKFFKITKKRCSPFSSLGAWINNTIYFECEQNC